MVQERSTVLLTLVVAVRSQMESFVVGGQYTPIFRYPHSSFLTVSCVDADQNESTWICGASIINQILLLTAGHCVYGCVTGTQISVNVGDRDRNSGMTRSANSFLHHKDYDPKTTSFDIALVRLFRPLTFSRRVSRVALMKRPPYKDTAHIAGWGLIDEETKTQSYILKQVNQYVWQLSDCENKLGRLPKGVLCASAKNDRDYPARGDSGSALVVQEYIQIGLVSYKVPTVAKNIIVYTDVGYYFDWIKIHVESLYCFKNINKVIPTYKLL